MHFAYRTPKLDDQNAESPDDAADKCLQQEWDNQRYAMALHFTTYNFVTPHGTLTKAAERKKTTPAMEAGLTDHPWTLLELLQEATKISTQS